MKKFYCNDEPTDYYSEYFEIAENQISELSRHLQTYLNHREATILAICGETQPSINTSQIKNITIWEEEMILQYHKYINYLEKNIINKEDLKFKFQHLTQILKSFPNSPEARSLKNFLACKIKLWKSLHIISGLEIHMRPQLLKRVIHILAKLCNDESKLNANIPVFFQQLNLNYQQLEQEYNQLLLTKEKGYHKSENKKEKVIVRE
ncbi:MAG: hypothetical protein ACFFHV_21745 [Promethearchaeota archaeon]